MKTLNTRAAALGMAGALALGTVASLGAVSPANALDTQYICTTTAGPLPFGVSAANPLAGPFVTGQQVPAQDVALNVGIAEAILGVVKLLIPAGTTSLSGTIADKPLDVAGQQVMMTGLAGSSNIPTTGGMVLPISGKTAPFTAPAPGSYPVTLPTSFDFLPSFLPTSVPCALGSSSSSTLGMMVVEKQSSTTTAKLKNAPITTTKHAKILAKVVAGGAPAAGKVIAKEGSKVLAKGTLSDTGKKTLVLPLLKRGSHKIVVKYKGNATTATSKKAVTFTVRRG